MKSAKSKYSYIKFYNRYAAHYNDNQLSAVSDLIAIREESRRRLKDLPDIIDQQAKGLETQINGDYNYRSRTIEPEVHIPNRNEDLIKKWNQRRDEFLNSLNADIKKGIHIVSPGYFDESYTSKISKLYKKHIPLHGGGEAISIIGNIVYLSVRIKRLQKSLSAIESVIGRITGMGFLDDELEIYSELSPEEELGSKIMGKIKNTLNYKVRDNIEDAEKALIEFERMRKEHPEVDFMAKGNVSTTAGIIVNNLSERKATIKTTEDNRNVRDWLKKHCGK